MPGGEQYSPEVRSAFAHCSVTDIAYFGGDGGRQQHQWYLCATVPAYGYMNGCNAIRVTPTAAEGFYAAAQQTATSHFSGGSCTITRKRRRPAARKCCLAHTTEQRNMVARVKYIQRLKQQALMALKRGVAERRAVLARVAWRCGDGGSERLTSRRSCANAVAAPSEGARCMRNMRLVTGIAPRQVVWRNMAPACVASNGS
jgi:hypothetical protein